MTWTTPLTWTDILSDASHFNQQIRDNLLALKAPPTALYESNEVSNYSISTSTYADIDTDFNLSITTTGGDVVIDFTGSIAASAAAGGLVDVSVDSTRIVNNTSGGLLFISNGGPRVYSFSHLIQGLSAGSHTFKLQWKSLAGATLTMYAGAGTANYDVHPRFWVREMT